MNDRVSAAPPVHFLGPDAIAALEQPVLLTAPSISSSNPRYSQDGGAGPSTSSSQTWSRKTGSRLFGQVWEGVRGKLRLRRDDNDAGKTPAAVISAATTTTAVTATNASAEAVIMAPIDIYTDPSERVTVADGPPASRTRSRVGYTPGSNINTPTASGFQFTGFGTARPSKDEVLASYQQLVAEGFFQSHAIQATRQCLAPPTDAAAPNASSLSAMGLRPTTSRGDFQQQLPPQWPLASPNRDLLQEPVQSPGSVSSRGTKRAAAADADEDDDDEDDGNARDEINDGGDDQELMSGDFDKENQAPPHPNTVKQKVASQQQQQQPKKRLRSIASRDTIFVPKTRSSGTRRSLSSSTAIASSFSSSSSSATTMNKLQKRRPGPLLTTRGHFDMPTRYQQQQQQQSQPLPASTRPRHVSDGGGSARVLRGGAAEEQRSLRVVPDADRGIPSVPAIPAKFTYGEDRQNNGPWRGLRIR